MSALVAIVYRLGKGCRQYPFESMRDLEKFCSRHPYRNEVLRVYPVINGKLLGDADSQTCGVMHASLVVDFVNRSGAAQ
jgi:hypothetical protein